ncbi:PAAR repeat-containing protein [Paraburkholderia sacchari]
MEMSDQQERKGISYALATIGARTERGGCVTSGSRFRIGGLAVACVGDVVTYEDGSQAVIVDGAGIAMVYGGAPVALVGSRLSNGDRIVSTIWSKRGIFIADGEGIEGLFDPEWVPQPRKPSARFAVRGATTPRGGVLKEATGQYTVSDVHDMPAARLGDFIEYADGTRARIITGVGMPGVPDMAFGVVGSLLDNGDVINDSPHRDVRVSTIFVPVDEHGVELTRHEGA